MVNNMRIDLVLAACFLLIVFSGACSSQTDKKIASASPVPAARSNTTPLAVGETAPDFTLSGVDGANVRLSDVGGPVVLVFYRGYW